MTRQLLKMFAYRIICGMNVAEIECLDVLRVLEQDVPASKGDHPAGRVLDGAHRDRRSVRSRIELVLDFAVAKTIPK